MCPRAPAAGRRDRWYPASQRHPRVPARPGGGVGGGVGGPGYDQHHRRVAADGPRDAAGPAGIAVTMKGAPETQGASPPLLRSFLFTTPLHPLLYEKKEHSGRRKGVAEGKGSSRRFGAASPTGRAATTTGAPASERDPRVAAPTLPGAPGAERCILHSKVQLQPSLSSAKCTSRRGGRGRGRGPVRWGGLPRELPPHYETRPAKAPETSASRPDAAGRDAERGPGARPGPLRSRGASTPGSPWGRGGRAAAPRRSPRR